MIMFFGVLLPAFICLFVLGRLILQAANVRRRFEALMRLGGLAGGAAVAPLEAQLRPVPGQAPVRVHHGLLPGLGV